MEVVTSSGAIAAQDVVVATNGYTVGILPELTRRIVPVGSGIIATDEIPEALMQRLLPRQRVYGNTKRVFSYFRHAPGTRRIVWGGRVGRRLGRTSPLDFSHLAADMLELFPELQDVGITHGWDGQIGYTYDEVLHIGRTAAGIHYAMGYCGTGVSSATYLGHKVALKVMDDPEGRTSFDDLTFPSFPFHPTAKRAVPLVESWYRIRDRFNI